jgi:hypothetical protein
MEGGGERWQVVREYVGSLHCLDIPKIKCGLMFDHNRPAPENQLEDKTNLKPWA